jgi:translocation and assembly module TamA
VEESYDIFEVLFGNLPDSTQKIIIERIGAEAYATLSPEFEAPIPNLRLTLRRSEDRLFIRDGDYLRLQLLGASEDLGANISFWQARLDSWHIRPLRENDRLLLRASLGYSDARSRDVLGVNFNQMPEYYEFRAGGARSVRGYGFEELFPDDAITGGKHQLVASIEYEREIIPDWSAAVFFDAGNAFNDFDNINPSHGVGFGVRWRSPVGLARIDLGFPLDDAEDSFQIYITVGPEF